MPHVSPERRYPRHVDQVINSLPNRGFSTSVHCPTARLCLPDGPERDPGFQPTRACRPGGGLPPESEEPRHLRRHHARPVAHLGPSQSARLRTRDQRVDARTPGHRERSARTDGTPGEPRGHPRCHPPFRQFLEAGQALDYESGSGVSPKKRRRDWLIQVAQRHPDWALGFEVETSLDPRAAAVSPYLDR
jgi:hypothetical protein